MRPTAICHLRQSLIEVERKFQCNRQSIERFRANRGVPAFRSLDYLGRSSFEDIYFDREKTLSARGIWVRKRNGHWQAKVRQGGSFANSQFEEVSNPGEIAQMILKLNVDAQMISDYSKSRGIPPSERRGK